MEDFKNTLFIAELQGQYTLWQNLIGEACNRADKIVQMGNIISAYPSIRDGIQTKSGTFLTLNSQILRYIQVYRATQPNWTQLVGKNEIIALNQAHFDVGEENRKKLTEKEADKILRRAWFGDDAWMKVASVDKGRLLTHGGLTYGMWKQIGSPKTAEEAAAALQERFEKTLFQSKSFNTGHPPNFSADPIWANSLTEVYPSWVTADEEAPFGQVHTGIPMSAPLGVELIRDDWGLLQYVDDIRYANYGSMTRIGGREFLCLHLGLPKKISGVLDNRWRLYREVLKHG